MMRHIRYLPLTFIAGTWGFVLFVPYLLAIFTTVGILRHRRAARAWFRTGI